MSLEIKVGPPQLAIHDGNVVLITQPDGQIAWPTAMGLYFLDTRMISAWSISANGVEWDLLNSGTPLYYLARIYLTNRTIPTEAGDIPARTLSTVIGRRLGGGMHEDLDITNHGPKPVRFNLEIVIRSDFADVFEVKSDNIVRRGRITSEWSESDQRLVNTYGNRDFHRSVAVTAEGNPVAAVFANGRISFEVALQPGETWHTCLRYELSDGNQVTEAPSRCADEPDSNASRVMDEWRASVTKLTSSNTRFASLYAQSLDDMAALRLPFATAARNVQEFVPAAGLPWFVALFGRDSLIVALQNALVYPDFAPRRAGRARPLAGNRARRLPRRRTRQDPPRTPPRRTGALQAHPAHALLRHRRRHAALPGHPPHRLALHRGPGHGPPADARRRRLPALDRRVGRPRRRRPAGIPDPFAQRLREHGLERLRRLRDARRRQQGRGPESLVRVAGLRLRRLDPHG